MRGEYGYWVLFYLKRRQNGNQRGDEVVMNVTQLGLDSVREKWMMVV